ncbi:tRNA-dihydrouridine(16/17) synthase [NAD(P)(+)]-like [Sycon ciliatum]|uniref:tRNA-dihydrouridine(16/17) synthase [NAD(P)(+)]-like n=1 Tax=Sycon ciliatum TaxID=27933 RepID=UPI0020A91449|eukprot:scpid35134/ scgid35669/ tRNA-dihydrouridine(16/17) synthase [NAD(P)(+)]-like; tRNA-dihydrouridine synthase 1-like
MVKSGIKILQGGFQNILSVNCFTLHVIHHFAQISTKQYLAMEADCEEKADRVTLKQVNEKAYAFWTDVLGSPRHIVAPMVDQSELPWRLLSRKYGAQLVYSPMYNAGVFLKDPNWRKQCLATCPEDRPLIVQFCANTPDAFVEAGRYAQHMCDAVDLNLGCPQMIAKRGHYGAFLQDEWDLLHRIVTAAVKELSVPVTCKVRVFADIEKTVRYARVLESAGCALLTVHGRLREQKGHKTGLASWEHIKAVKESVSIPVVANGNIRYLSDVDACLAETGVDGVMTAEGNLTNPALFTGKMPPAWCMADEYFELAKQYQPHQSAARAHMFRLWHKCLPLHPDLRTQLASAQGLDGIAEISRQLAERMKASCEGAEIDEMAAQHTDGSEVEPWRCQPHVRAPLTDTNTGDVLGEKRTHPDGADAEKPKKIKRPANKRKGGNPAVSREVRKSAAFKSKFKPCTACSGNPRGMKCDHELCRACCKVHSVRNVFDCTGHKFSFKSRAERQQKEADQAGAVHATDNGDASNGALHVAAAADDGTSADTATQCEATL